MILSPCYNPFVGVLPPSSKLSFFIPKSFRESAASAGHFSEPSVRVSVPFRFKIACLKRLVLWSLGFSIPRWPGQIFPAFCLKCWLHRPKKAAPRSAVTWFPGQPLALRDRRFPAGERSSRRCSCARATQKSQKHDHRRAFSFWYSGNTELQRLKQKPRPKPRAAGSIWKESAAA